MAGSYRHLVGRDGKFSMDLIEDMGDAREALEECYGRIGILAGDPERLEDAVRQLHSRDVSVSFMLQVPRAYIAPAIARQIISMLDRLLPECGDALSGRWQLDGEVTVTEPDGSAWIGG